jgi:PAS domain S-box-containing protein
MAASMHSVAERRLALAIAAAQLGSWTWDMASGITTWDERLEEMHGLPPGGFGGTFEDWVAALHPDDRAECIALVEAALANPGPYRLVHRTTWADGSEHVVECRGTVLTDSEGRPAGTTGVAIDVTNRERRAAAVDEALAHERNLVRTFQRALLPSSLPSAAGTAVAARYRAAETDVAVGGDWYAVVGLPDGLLGLAIGDVAGHGVDAVADMAAARFSLRALALTEPRPDVVLERLNQVVKVFEGDAMITALYGVLDPHERSWTYAAAGHPPVVLRCSDGRTRLLDEANDPPLGVATGFRTRQVQLEPGATLVLYTDGLVERRGEDIDAGLHRLADALTRYARLGPERLADALLARLGVVAGARDDIALIVVRL